MPRHPALPVATVLVALVLLLAGCGDDGGGDEDSSSGGRPSVDEMAAELSGDGQLSDEQAECLARAFVESDISDDALTAMVDAGSVQGVDTSADDQAAVQAATQEALACATQGAIDDIEDGTTTTAAPTTAAP